MSRRVSQIHSPSASCLYWVHSYLPLVGLLQETPVERLQPILVKQLQAGETDLRQLIAAAALANAETFGGQDYVGFHTEMALIPALEMTRQMPKPRQALPVLKVLYRNTGRIQESGSQKKKTLRPIKPATLSSTNKGGASLREATRSADMQRAESLFAAQAKVSTQEAYNHLLWSVQDSTDVHRFVLAYRAWGLIEIVGSEHAHTMLRQCVRFCVNSEQNMKKRNYPASPVRKLIPKLIDQYKLAGRKLGTRIADDAWVLEMARLIYRQTGAKAMEAVAAALAEGFSQESVADAISLASSQLVLCQDKLGNGSTRVHGATPGVHTSDAAHAWRHMARVSNQRNAIVGLMVSAFHTGGYKTYAQEPYPHQPHRDEIKATSAKALLAETEEAIRSNNQGRASAAIQIYGEQGHSPDDVFKLMLRYAVSEDGRLHGEKYYRTVAEEFKTIRPSLRSQQLVSLARVTASAYGYTVKDAAGFRAPGYEEACRLLGVEA